MYITVTLTPSYRMGL